MDFAFVSIRWLLMGSSATGDYRLGRRLTGSRPTWAVDLLRVQPRIQVRRVAYRLAVEYRVTTACRAVLPRSASPVWSEVAFPARALPVFAAGISQNAKKAGVFAESRRELGH